jgi:LysR family transcriptional regulator, glycine cleavage system transcriptional activator
VRPFAHELRGPYEYYLVCPEASADRPQVRTFRKWVLEQSAPMRDSEASAA